jgi:antitoxin component YwqK of YwqJK toxin-antitoxin module
MKQLFILLIFILNAVFISHAQGVGLTQLKGFITAGSIDRIKQELALKNWEFLKVDTIESKQLLNYSWAYKRDLKKNEAVAWLTVSMDGAQPIRVMYELFDLSLTTKMTASIVSSDFKYAAIKEDETEFTTRYEASQYYLWEYMNKIYEKGHQYELIRKYTKIDPFNGEKLTYYPSGKLKSSVLMKDGKANGKAVYYYENGQLEEVTMWKDDVQHGLTEYYNEAGIKEKDVTFENGHLSGVSNTYYPSGAIAATCMYLYDKLNGPGTDFSEDGKVTATYQYIYGELFGAYKEYTDENLTFSGNYIKGKLVGPFNEVIIANNGALMGSTKGNYWNDVLDGRIIAMYANGTDTMSVRKYDKGVPVGVWRYFSPDGQLDEIKEFKNGYAVEQKLYTEGVLHVTLNQLPESDSTMRYFRYNSMDESENILVNFGIPSSQFQGSKNEFSTFYKVTNLYGESGIVQAHFKNGFYCYDQADLSYSGNYLNGVKDGEWNRFFKKKKIASRQLFENGSLISEQFFKKNGKPYSGELTYHSAGNTIVIAVKNGFRNGKTTTYNRYGSVESELLYENGQLVTKE